MNKHTTVLDLSISVPSFLHPQLLLHLLVLWNYIQSTDFLHFPGGLSNNKIDTVYSNKPNQYDIFNDKVLFIVSLA